MPSYITDQERLEQELDKNKKNSNPEKPIKTTKETRTTTYEKVGNTDTDTVRDEPEKEYTPSNAYWDFINNSLDQYKPKPNTPDAERQQRLAKVHAITEGLRTLGEAFALHKGAPVERRNPNENVLRALQEYNRIRATDDAKADAFNNMAMNLRLKAMAQDEENRYRTNRDKKEDERFNKKMEFEREQFENKQDKPIDPLDKKKKEKEIEKLQADIDAKKKEGLGKETDETVEVIANDGIKDKLDSAIINKLINYAKSKGEENASYIADVLEKGVSVKAPSVQTAIAEFWQKYKYDVLDGVKDPSYDGLRRKQPTNDKVKPVNINPFQTRPTLKGEGILKPEYLEEASEVGKPTSQKKVKITPDAQYIKEGKLDVDRVKNEYNSMSDDEKTTYLSAVFNVPLDKDFDTTISEIKEKLKLK